MEVDQIYFIVYHSIFKVTLAFASVTQANHERFSWSLSKYISKGFAKLSTLKPSRINTLMPKTLTLFTLDLSTSAIGLI